MCTFQSRRRRPRSDDGRDGHRSGLPGMVRAAAGEPQDALYDPARCRPTTSSAATPVQDLQFRARVLLKDAKSRIPEAAGIRRMTPIALTDGQLTAAKMSGGALHTSSMCQRVSAAPNSLRSSRPMSHGGRRLRSRAVFRSSFDKLHSALP